MYRLLNWFFIGNDRGNIIAVGNVIDNPKFYSGKTIHTSIIESVSIDDKKRQFIIKTYSGSLYIAKYKDVCIECIEDIEECLRNFKITKENLKGFENTYKGEKDRLKDYVSSILNPNELYIEMAGVSALRAFFMTNERELKEIPITIHVGMFQDSVLITDFENNVDFRFFFNPNEIRPYSWNEELKTIKIYNFGYNINFRHEDKVVQVKSNELTVISNTY